MNAPDTTARVSVGDELELTIDALAFGGAGVARTAGGYVVFVDGALPGDRVRAAVHKRKRAYAQAALSPALPSNGITKNESEPWLNSTRP